MVVVGVLVGTFEPALVMVTIAHTNNASATKNTVAPSPAAGVSAGMNGKGMNQLSPSPASTASAHAIGGRKRTWAVSGSVILVTWGGAVGEPLGGGLLCDSRHLPGHCGHPIR